MKFKWKEDLSPLEGRIWRILYLADGEVVIYDDIYRRAWGYSFDSGMRSCLMVSLVKMRKKGYNIKTHNKIGLSLNG